MNEETKTNASAQ